MCGDEPIIDDPKSRDYNVERRVNRFLEFMHDQRKSYTTQNIMVTMGGDFNYLDAHYYFKNLEKLIRYVNEKQTNGSDVNVFYSTPSCYLKSLHDSDVYWPTKQDDFFPYASDPHSYWTGYFTSRPTLKYFERFSNNYLQIAKQLAVTSGLMSNSDLYLNPLREAMGIMQHHDAITGTEKQHVAEDYARILSKAVRKSGQLVSEAINKLMAIDRNSTKLEMKSCLLLNISECTTSSESHTFMVSVYNPYSKSVNYTVRLPVHENGYSIRDANGSEIPFDVMPIPAGLKSIPGRVSKTKHELVFEAQNVPALGYTSYFITKTNESADPVGQTESAMDLVILTRGPLKTSFNVTSGSIIFHMKDRDIEVEPKIQYYHGAEGNNMVFENRSSGAYIFRPNGSVPISLESTSVKTYEGKGITEIHVNHTNWASYVIRGSKNWEYIELEWLVGPIPITDSRGKEVILKYVSQMNSNKKFKTDSSGRGGIERVLDFRPTWDLELKEPVAGNYYPITTDISINDDEFEFAVLIDRAQGGSSLKDGEVELMVHRRLLRDDAFGVGEALNETAYGKGLIARGRHWLTIGPTSKPEWNTRKRSIQQQKVLDCHILLANLEDMDFDEWSQIYRLEFSGLTTDLQHPAKILTLEPWKKSAVLLRLENILDGSETKNPTSVSLKNRFRNFDILSVRETTLAANEWLDESSRFKWKKESNEIPTYNYSSKVTEDTMVVDLGPKSIRTFICDVKYKDSSDD